MNTTETADRIGDWMMTSTGERFYPLDPRPSEIHIADIAHHLARVCRYGGAVAGYYSVAEHCCLLADYFAPDVELARWALMHDGAEAYIGDLIRPIKPRLPSFVAIEAPLEQMIWRKFGLRSTFLPPTVKAADSAIIGDECVALFSAEILTKADWRYGEGLGVPIQQWTAVRAAGEFMLRFRDLFPGYVAP